MISQKSNKNLKNYIKVFILVTGFFDTSLFFVPEALLNLT
jgi:hypothetical protein